MNGVGIDLGLNQFSCCHHINLFIKCPTFVYSTAGEALEGLRGETANPVVGEISRETHSLSTLIGCEGHACVGSGMKRKGLS